MAHATVLVIDQDETLRDTLGDLLADHGYAVAARAEAGGAAALLEARPDVLCIELRLAFRSAAWDTIAALRRDPRARRLPVIAMTDDLGPTEGQAADLAALRVALVSKFELMASVPESIAAARALVGR